MIKLPRDDVFIFDIETDSIDTDKAKLKYFGGYSYITGKRYYIKGDDERAIETIKDIVRNHGVFVGFNQKNYDVAVLNKYGVYFQYKVQVDLWEIISEARIEKDKNGNNIRTGGKGRGLYMGLNLNSWSLANVIKNLELGELKMDFDYSVLEKSCGEWTKEEEQYIVDYLAQDITITKRLFEYTNNFFYAFTEMLSEENVMRFTYLTSSIASLAYKIICHEADIPETYSDNNEGFNYVGGYVREPIQEKYVGEILCLDFKSLYPSIFRGFNLFSPATKDDKHAFTGNEVFTIKGQYKTDELGDVEKVVADLYARRQEYKKVGDNREYLIKIIINSLYGITAKPVFEQVYSRHGGEDCTAIGRQMIKHTAKVFDQAGYEVLYGDTDSVYIAIGEGTKEDALELAEQTSEFFKANMPFPHEDFGLGLDYEIKAMFFFSDGMGGFKKKNYVYITKDDELKIMGLPIIKSNASKIATKILYDHLEQHAIDNLDIKFKEGYIKELIYFELEKDISLGCQTYKVRDLESYNSENSLYAQISSEYGAGVHELVTNNRFGVGQAKKYCTIKEFKDKGGNVRDINLDTALRNLEPFIQNPQTALEDYF